MILIDTHVHIYSCFNLKTFFDSTVSNFKQAALRIDSGQGFSAILILTDWAGKNWFRKLSITDNNRNASGVKIENWTCHTTSESSSLFFTNSIGDGFYIIAGRKIITTENLEVLALATNDTEFPDGLTLIETIQLIKSRESIAVVPWAVGKWLGKRGKVLDELIATLDPKSYFLCDNSNRPLFWSKPRHFRVFEAKGGRILSGSDPLHFSTEVNRAGSFGCWINGSIEHNEPTKHFKAILNDRSNEIGLYGELENTYRFFRNQIAMQLLKKKWKREYYSP